MKKSTFLTSTTPSVLLGACSIAMPMSALANAEFTLEEVVVTARKVEENSQTVPVAITSMSADFVKQAGIRDVADTLQFTPGATLISSSPLEQQYSIRGVSSGSEGAASESSVLVMVDGEVLSRDFMRSISYFDLERVEVLRGPQGIAYGKNATGGLVHLLSKKPHQDFEASVALGLGNFNEQKLESVINGEIGENLFGRLSASSSQRDGYTDDIVTGDDLDNWENNSVRAQLLYTPNDLEVLVKLHWMDEEGGQTPRKNFNVDLPYDSPLGTSFTELSRDPWRVSNSSSLDFGTVRTVEGINLQLVKPLGDYALTSITSYRDAEAEMNRDGFGTPDDLFLSSSYDNAHTFSQELRLDNSGGDSSMLWVTGLFYSSDTHHRIEDRVLAAAPIAGGTVETLDYIDQRSKNTGMGVFGEVRYDLSPSLTLAVGTRYSKDKKDFQVFHRSEGALSFAFLNDPSPISVSANESWEAITGSIALTYEISDSIMAYSTVSTGYKGGGFNGEATTALAAQTPFDEEQVRNIEFGLKSELLDRRLRINAAFFDLDYTDIQLESFADGAAAPIIDNAGEANIRGMELDLQAAISSAFTLSGGLAIYDHEYIEYVKDGNDLAGNKLANVPDWTFNLSAQYAHTTSSGGSLNARLDYNTRSDIFDDAENWDESDGGSNGLRERVDRVNARIGWAPASGTWELALWAKNLL